MRKRFAVITAKIVYPKKRDSYRLALFTYKSYKSTYILCKITKMVFCCRNMSIMLKTVISRIYNK